MLETLTPSEVAKSLISNHPSRSVADRVGGGGIDKSCVPRNH